MEIKYKDYEGHSEIIDPPPPGVLDTGRNKKLCSWQKVKRDDWTGRKREKVGSYVQDGR